MTKYQNFPEQSNLIYHISGANNDPRICDCPFDDTNYVIQTWNWYNSIGEPVDGLVKTSGYTSMYSTSNLDCRTPYIYTGDYDITKLNSSTGLGFMLCKKQANSPMSGMSGWVKFAKAEPGCMIRIFSGQYIEAERKTALEEDDKKYINLSDTRLISPKGSPKDDGSGYNEIPDIPFIEAGKWYYFNIYGWRIGESTTSYPIPQYTEWYCANDNKWYRSGNQLYGINDKYNVVKSASTLTPSNSFLGIGFYIRQYSGVYLSDLKWYSTSQPANGFHKSYYFGRTVPPTSSGSVTGSKSYALCTTADFVEDTETANKLIVAKNGNFVAKNPVQFYETANSQLIFTKDKKIKINEMIEV